MTVLLRTNKCLKPEPTATDNSGWTVGFNNGAVSSSFGVVAGLPSANGCTLTFTTPPTISWNINLLNSIFSGVTPGQTISVSLTGKQSWAGGQTGVTLQFFDGAGASLGYNGGPRYTLAANTVTTITYTIVVPTNAASVAVFWDAQAGTMPPINGTAVIGSPILEVASSNGVYFDGSTPATQFKTYAWTGAANASTSTESSVLDLPADSYSLNDIELRYWKARSGLGLGYSLQDYKSAAIKSILALSNLSISDLEWNYWKSLSGLANGSVQDHREKVTNYNDRAYYASFFK